MAEILNAIIIQDKTFKSLISNFQFSILFSCILDLGKFIHDLGDYNNCLFNSPKYKYFTMRFLNKLVGTQYIGLCAPSACSEQILSNNFSQQVYQQSISQELLWAKTAKMGSILLFILFLAEVSIIFQCSFAHSF